MTTARLYVLLLGAWWPGHAAGYVLQPVVRSQLPLRRTRPAHMVLPPAVSFELALTAAEWNSAGRGSTPENPSDLPAEFVIWGVGSLLLLALGLVGAVIFKVRQAGLADEAAAQAVESVTEALAANEEIKTKKKKKKQQQQRA